ncbi:DUF1883 domain-containing protein [Campylobacter geochelonis]|uniref:ADP-ribosyl cyclase/cyclic ADP-ribose hydrolase n=1 Tax=Campylobacter geochelonis TaxID=1780362 RepID=A0A128EBF6_9BACT|nr:DUF1883 domain-containing protein [Campylobacter geochelonis]QKF70676.1 DUF1883 and TIR domain-containing protein [Campylobacter geochelonis]CZE45807.1 Uncharacterized protein containing a TIR (Toll-Interleukin 1-resistance) domain [Campylobacter geochelonis]
MEFTKYDFGQLEKGRIVEITLQGSAANVQLMDSSNFNNYKNGRRYRYVGGLAKQSPIRLATTHSGHWYLAIDMRGLVGRVRSSARVLPQALPTIKQRPLSEIPSLVHNTGFILNEDAGIEPQYDVFISHASEDKDEVVRPLANALINKGVSVWYDEFELRIGDSLRRKIDKGLANSRFGIVVVSRDFIKKGWTNYELDGIITKAVSGEQIVLPIWHNITKREVIDYSPSLADKLARNTAVDTIEEIANEISTLILENKNPV